MSQVGQALGPPLTHQFFTRFETACLVAGWEGTCHHRPVCRLPQSRPSHALLCSPLLQQSANKGWAQYQRSLWPLHARPKGHKSVRRES